MRTREIIQVSANLSPRGGGTATVGRLIAGFLHGYCQEHDLHFRILELGPPDYELPGVQITHFHNRQLAMLLATWRVQLQSPQPYLVFDFLGPARAQAFLPAALRAPYAIYFHGLEYWRPLAWDRRRAILGADLHFVNSHYSFQRGRGILPWLPQFHVLHPALSPAKDATDTVDAAAADADLIAQIKDKSALIVGRLSAHQRHKGHDDLLHAFPHILQEHPDAQLVIVGAGDDMPRLQAKAVALGLQDHTLFTGFVDDATLKAIYARCALFAMPSHDDGFGLVYLEAMRAGKACIGLRDASAADIILDGETGLLVEREHSASLASAISRLFADAAACAAMGQAGQQRWREHFSYQTFANKLRDHLDAWLQTDHNNANQSNA